MKQIVTCAILFACSAPAGADVPRVRFTGEPIVPPLGPFTYLQVVEMNDAGVVIGMAPDDPGANGVMRPFRWDGGIAEFLPSPPEGLLCGEAGGEYWVRGMNNAGQIVGSGIAALPGGGCEPNADGVSLRSPQDLLTILDVDVLGEEYSANDVDDFGRIVGTRATGPANEWWPCRWMDGIWLPMPSPSPSYSVGEVRWVSKSGLGIGGVGNASSGVPVAWDLNSNECIPLSCLPFCLSKVRLGSNNWIVGQDVPSEMPTILNFDTNERRILESGALQMMHGWATACDALADSVVGNGVFLLIPPGSGHLQQRGAVFHHRAGEMALLECDLPLTFPRVPLDSFGFEWMSSAGQIVVLLADGQFWRFTPLLEPVPSPDFDCSRSVDGADLAILLGNWGGVGLGDLDESGAVDGADLAMLLGAWTN